jgi:hypothetical protein
VAIISSKVLDKLKDNTRAVSKTDVIVKLKAFEFRFRRELVGYVSEPDFIPMVWVKRDNPEDGDDGTGDGGGDAMDTSESRPSVV